MTTFEITIIVLLVAIVVLLAWHFLLTRNNYSLNQTKELKRQQDFERLLSKLQSILDVCNQQQNAWACDVTTIVKRLNELADIVDKMHRNLCVDIADKMVDRVCPSTRTIKVKGQRCELTDEELMKRINEDNKED